MLFNNELNLDDDEKQIFLRAVLKTVVSDAKLQDNEITIVKQLGKAYHITQDMLAYAKANFKQDITDEELAKISSIQKKFELIKILCAVASIDNTLEDVELDFIIDLADRMGVNRNKLLEINKLVQEILFLQEKNRIIMGL